MLPTFRSARLHLQIGGLAFPALSLSGEDALPRISSRPRRSARTCPPQCCALKDREGRVLPKGHADDRIAALLRDPA